MLETHGEKAQATLRAIGIALVIFAAGVVVDMYTGINYFWFLGPLALFGLYKRWAWAKALLAIFVLLLAVVALAAVIFNFVGT